MARPARHVLANKMTRQRSPPLAGRGGEPTQAAMTELERILAANACYAALDRDTPVPSRPSRRLVILTCMDARRLRVKCPTS